MTAWHPFPDWNSYSTPATQEDGFVLLSRERAMRFASQTRLMTTLSRSRKFALETVTRRMALAARQRRFTMQFSTLPMA